MSMEDREKELDDYAKRLNAAMAARIAEERGDGVTLHAAVGPTICDKCGGLDRDPRPEGCPNCLTKHFFA